MAKFIKFWFDRVRESLSRARGRVELALFVLFLLSKPVSAVFPGYSIDNVVWLGGALLFLIVFIIEVCFVASYRHSESIESKLNEFTNTEKREREKRVKECVDETIGILKTNPLIMPFHALSRANAYRLESNGEVVEACEQIEAYGHEHPLRGLEGHVPKGDWLAFLKRVMYAPGVNPHDEVDYLLEAEKWRQDHGYPDPTRQRSVG